MPTLREYKPSSSKSGYYIQANVGGSHPITLQVTNIAGTILEETGHGPGQVPSKLAWAMYDLGLLYTNNSLDPSQVEDVSTEQVFRELDLGNRLTPAQRERVVGYIERYEGPHKEKLTRLKEELEAALGSDGATGAVNGPDQPIGEDIPETETEAVSYLYLITDGVREFRTAMAAVNPGYLLKSLQTFIPHPHVMLRHAEVDGNWNIRYRMERDDTDQTVYLTDQRGAQRSSDYPDADYTLRIEEADGAAEAAIQDQEISDFSPAQEVRYNQNHLQQDLAWILPDDPVELDEIIDKESFDLHNDRIELVRDMEPAEIEQMELEAVTVKRISNSGNPVIYVDGEVRILDRGNPDERYLARHSHGQKWTAVARIND